MLLPLRFSFSSCICSSQPCSSALFLAVSSAVPHHLMAGTVHMGTCTHPCCAQAPAVLVPYCPRNGFTCVPTAHTLTAQCCSHPQMFLQALGIRALAAPCAMPGQQRAVPLGHPAPREPGMLTSLHTLNYGQGFNSMVFRPWLQSNIFSCYYPLFTAF